MQCNDMLDILYENNLPIHEAMTGVIEILYAYNDNECYELVLDFFENVKMSPFLAIHAFIERLNALEHGDYYMPLFQEIQEVMASDIELE